MTKLVKYDPFAELRALQHQFFGEDWLTPFKGVSTPTTDVYTKGDDLVIEAHLPNFDEKDVSVEIDEGALVINAEKHEKEEDKKKKYVVRESSSSFYRRIQLPERADVGKVKADLSDGILEVTIPLEPIPEPKKISVSSKEKSSK
ncbi:MAG: Hsp20/alpha crystallin family protein [Candidatus Saccharimonas sp.]